MNIDSQFLSRLRLLSIVKGMSTLLLFGIAMPLKYLADIPSPCGSSAHFTDVCLANIILLAIRGVPITKGLVTGVMIAAVLALGPCVFDRWLGESGNAK